VQVMTEFSKSERYNHRIIIPSPSDNSILAKIWNKNSEPLDELKIKDISDIITKEAIPMTVLMERGKSSNASHQDKRKVLREILRKIPGNHIDAVGSLKLEELQDVMGKVGDCIKECSTIGEVSWISYNSWNPIRHYDGH
jgi:hypothetical protein